MLKRVDLAKASYEHSFATLGVLELMDRVERLAFNALPAALTGDMWTHVYVQQANSVYAGVTHPNSTRGRRGAGHSHAHDAARAASKSCPRGACSADGGDGPSAFEEIQDVNYFGVSHFPCCITNFPQVRLILLIGACAILMCSPVASVLRTGQGVETKSAVPRGLTETCWTSPFHRELPPAPIQRRAGPSLPSPLSCGNPRQRRLSSRR